jgi:glycosyltransferase involved in cell wall biosynthesis
MVLLDTLAAGGAERLAVELVCAVDTSEFDRFVVVTKRGGPLERQLRDAGVPYAILGRRHLTSVRPFADAVRLARRSDLIHSHLFGNNVWGAILARIAGVPLIAHEHNRVGRHVRLESMLDRLLIAPAAARIVCASESVARALVQAGLPRRLVEVAPNGVRLGQALDRSSARRRLALPADAGVVGIVGSLRPEKAHDVLLRSFASLVRGGRHPQLQLCIVGDGSCRAALERQASDLGVAGHVDFAGERADAPELQAAFDVSVVASTSEGLPLAALEALAAGTPLIGTTVGGLPELLANGAGLLVDPGDEQALATAISDVLDDPALRLRLKEAGRRRVSERHDLAATVAHVEAIYRTVLERPFEEPDRRGEDLSVRRVESVV